MEYFFNFDKLDYVKGKRPSGCALCKIVKGSRDVEDLSLYSNDLFLVSLNLYPYNPGHLLLFPKRHIEDLREMSKEEQDMERFLTNNFLNILDKTHEPSAYNIGYNMGLTAGASIAHLHMHIIPRYPREIGISDLLAGKKVLVEDPRVTQSRIRQACKDIGLQAE